jgi:hypothetical protein
VARGEHQRDGAAVGVANDLCAFDSDSIHEGRDTVGRGFQARVEPVDALRLAHVELVDGVDAGLLGQHGEVAPPVARRAHQAMDKDHGPARSRMEIMHAGAENIHLGFGMALCGGLTQRHGGRSPLVFSGFLATFRDPPKSNVTGE